MRFILHVTGFVCQGYMKSTGEPPSSLYGKTNLQKGVVTNFVTTGDVELIGHTEMLVLFVLDYVDIHPDCSYEHYRFTAN